jgi:Uma2 family endonuclease
MSVVADVPQPFAEVVAPPPPPTPNSPQMPQVPLWRLSVDKYHDMVRYGILTEDDNVELLNGLLIAKMTKSTAHCAANWLAQDSLAKVISEGWHVDSQNAITLATSEPEPDVAVVRGQARDYLEHHPSAGELALVVEVSDSSLRHDQVFKKAIYAAAAIPVYWIINLIDRQVEVYTDPTGPAEQPDYGQRRAFSGTEQVPVVIAGREVARIPVRELLP